MLRKILKAVCLVPPALMLWQCDAFKPKTPSPYASTVQLRFTPMAAAAMARAGDGFVVLAYYYGDPTPQARAKADKVGRLMLGEDRAGWSGNTRRVPLAGKVDTSLLPQIRGETQMLVNVYSVTKEGAADDLIVCTSWIGTVKMAQARSPVVGCELETGDSGDAHDLVDSDSRSR